jgi:FixJ family two-component response regulator
VLIGRDVRHVLFSRFCADLPAAAYAGTHLRYWEPGAGTGLLATCLWEPCRLQDQSAANLPDEKESSLPVIVAQDVSAGGTAQDALPDRIRVLLVEDDDGDALIVEELLLDAGSPFLMQRARTLAEARQLLGEVNCVLLDLELPDARGLQGVRWLQESLPSLAVVVLTGLADEHLGSAAVGAGAQDYLVKGQVDGFLLHRVVRYAIERRRAEEAQQQLAAARLYAAENARLERGLLPSPLLSDERLSVAARYRPGGGQMLLGGDFYDVVEAADGWVHAVVGDVCGRGPDEAALGVCLRVAWRTMVLAGRPMGEILGAVQQVLENERHQERLFATLCMLSVAPERTHGRLHLAGHPQPLLISEDGVRELEAPICLPPGITHATKWPSAEVQLGTRWSALLYTDGLIEGKVGSGPERLSGNGLIKLIEKDLAQDAPVQAPDAAAGAPAGAWLLDSVIGQARELNGGELDDDLAVLLVSCSGHASDDQPA